MLPLPVFVSRAPLSGTFLPAVFSAQLTTFAFPALFAVLFSALIFFVGQFLLGAVALLGLLVVFVLPAFVLHVFYLPALVFSIFQLGLFSVVKFGPILALQSRYQPSLHQSLRRRHLHRPP